MKIPSPLVAILDEAAMDADRNFTTEIDDERGYVVVTAALNDVAGQLSLGFPVTVETPAEEK